VCINELRTALGDTAQTPRYIETVHRRGYRWIGTLPLTAPSPAAGAPSPPPASPLPTPTTPQPPPGVHSRPLTVGRAAAGAQLHEGPGAGRPGGGQGGGVGRGAGGGGGQPGRRPVGASACRWAAWSGA